MSFPCLVLLVRGSATCESNTWTTPGVPQPHGVTRAIAGARAVQLARPTLHSCWVRVDFRRRCRKRERVRASGGNAERQKGRRPATIYRDVASRGGGTTLSEWSLVHHHHGLRFGVQIDHR